MGEKFIKDIDGICIHNVAANSMFGEILDGYDTAYANVMKWLSEYKEKPHIPSIKNVIFHDPATIVWWEDGTKTVVKAEGEKYDPEKGLTMAISKKALGNKGNYYEVIKKWVGDLMPRCEDVAEKKTLKKSKKDCEIGEETKKTVEHGRKNRKKRN